MELKTFRAATMQEALSLVRRELGPSAAVLHTREVRGGLWGWLPGRHRYEVVASAQVNVPSRLAKRPAATGAATTTATANAQRGGQDFPRQLQGQLSELHSMVERLCRNDRGVQHDLPPALFELFTDLIEDDVSEAIARELVDRVRAESAAEELQNVELLRERLSRMVEREIRIRGAVAPPPGRCHLVALVGPTGVGKTTTIAKLAANFRLREKRRVGLITVDTYRIAAVEQLRTYADIIDLPMEVVSSPREIRTALSRMADLDLILMDTAGRSPRDEVKIQELRAFLQEARADEVHLVLSSVASASTLERTAQQFAVVGTTALLLTKLDEAVGTGHLLPLLRSCKLPISYLTDGQNVPDDIRPADARRVARLLLGSDRHAEEYD